MIAFPAFWLQLIAETTALVRELWRRNRGDATQARAELRAIRDHWSQLSAREATLDARLLELERASAVRARAVAGCDAILDAITQMRAEIPLDSAACARLEQIRDVCTAIRSAI